jgi:hypothetical protein
MTAQISDQYTYKRKEYDLVACTAPIEIDPNEYGLNPTAPHTACWRGYWCEYGIVAGKLILRTLHIFCGDGCYPDLFGVKAAKTNARGCEMEYRNINQRVDFSGSIVLGRNFIQDYYIHMGFQQPWAYLSVIELALDKGLVLSEIDTDPGFLRNLDANILLFIEKSFSLDAKDKAWWI